MTLSPSPPSQTDAQPPIVETVGSLCWLAMDAAWMMDWKVAATLLVVPSVVAHLVLFRHTSRKIVPICVTASMNCWVGMNAFWMLAEVWHLPTLLLVAKLLCALATLLILAAFLHSWGRHERSLIARFRRVRVSVEDKAP